MTRRLLLLAAAMFAVAGAAVAADQYGAIAFNKGTRAYGYSFNQSSRAAAERRALSECGSGCASMAWVANGCTALAINSSRYGTANGATRSAAERDARARCGMPDCRVLVHSCTDRAYR